MSRAYVSSVAHEEELLGLVAPDQHLLEVIAGQSVVQEEVLAFIAKVVRKDGLVGSSFLGGTLARGNLSRPPRPDRKDVVLHEVEELLGAGDTIPASLELGVHCVVSVRKRKKLS